MSSKPSSKSNLQIPSLDGIRALSVGLVILAHAGLDSLVPGGFGVTTFFFLSGFLITTLMRKEFEKNGHVNLGHFWLRRILRILPPFYIVLAGATLLTWLLRPPGSLSIAALVAQCLQFANYWQIGHGIEGMSLGTVVYWSLAVEEHFYFLFPWLYVGMQKARVSPRGQALLLWALCAAVLLWRCYLVYWQNAPIDRTYLASDTRVDSILFGCALAVWRNPVLDPPVLGENWWKWLLLPLSLAILVLGFSIRGDAFRETIRYSLQGAALTLFFIAAIRFHRWPIFRLLNTQPAIFVGALSYSLYLVHFPVISAMPFIFPDLGHATGAVIAIAIAVGLAWAVRKWVEQPCARVRKRLID